MNEAMLTILDKEDLALLYRTLRDSIVEKQNRKAEVTNLEYIVLGKLKILLNVI